MTGNGAHCRGLGNMPGVLSQPVAMDTDRSGEDEDPPATYMPIVPAGMSTSAPAPQVRMQPDSCLCWHPECCSAEHRTHISTPPG